MVSQNRPYTTILWLWLTTLSITVDDSTDGEDNTDDFTDEEVIDDPIDVRILGVERRYS